MRIWCRNTLVRSPYQQQQNEASCDGSYEQHRHQVIFLLTELQLLHLPLHHRALAAAAVAVAVAVAVVAQEAAGGVVPRQVQGGGAQAPGGRGTVPGGHTHMAAGGTPPRAGAGRVHLDQSELSIVLTSQSQPSWPQHTSYGLMRAEYCG